MEVLGHKEEQLPGRHRLFGGVKQVAQIHFVTGRQLSGLKSWRWAGAAATMEHTRKDSPTLLLPRSPQPCSSTLLVGELSWAR